jgi:hypothetical protein
VRCYPDAAWCSISAVKCEKDVQCVDVLADHLVARHAVSAQRLGHIESLHVIGREAGDRHVVIIDHELDVEVLSDGEARGLGVVTL